MASGITEIHMLNHKGESLILDGRRKISNSLNFKSRVQFVIHL